jgi:hypothetical protein
MTSQLSGRAINTITFRWLDAAGDPINLTQWTPRAKSLSIDFNPVVTDPVNGEVQIALSRAETIDLPLGIERWDWIFIFVTGNVTPPLLAGSVEIKEPVTETG